MARYDLRLDESAFRRLTPRLLFLLLDRHQAAEFGKYHRAAMVKAVLVNVYRDTKKYPRGFSEKDFIPKHLWPKEWRKKSIKVGNASFDEHGNVAVTNISEMDPAQRREFFSHIFGCGGGKSGQKSKKPVAKSARNRPGTPSVAEGQPGKAKAVDPPAKTDVRGTGSKDEQR